ncbi:cilia- and flagella-associated protein 53-like [Apostichopus japonicus]|uniref:cilia- and flagella-associated protein 53-like n=1 Tax=Stichopus japonicus TaxID=307972 RepID=UPI003AB47D46
MLAYQKPRKTREFTGPTPHSVAIRAKMPSKQPPDHLILERRKRDDMREEAVAVTKYNALCDLKNDWEQITDRRILQNTVKRRVKGLLQNEEFALEDRRQKLKELLAEEEELYMMEMEAGEETQLERQAKMRERAKSLKEKREQERLQLVAEKMDQRWREGCEELRATLTRRHMDEVCIERGEQLQMKEEKMAEDKMYDSFYAQQWEEDRQAKAAREEREAAEAHARNKDMLDTLRIQMAAVQAKKDEEKRLKIEGGQLRKEESELRKLEEQRALQEKKAQQQAMRDGLDKSLKIRARLKAREIQEELALDMQILEKLLEDSRNEAMEITQRKKEMREEDQRYREYLQQQMEEEKRLEKELDAMIESEVKRQWQKRLDQWAKEKDARKRLMNDVLSTRRRQLQEKVAENEKAQAVAAKETELMLAAMEEHRRLEEEKRARVFHENKQYEQDLLQQVNFRLRMEEHEKDEDYREYLKGLETEAEYQAKLKEALARPNIDKLHPFRKAHMTKQAGQKLM